MRWLDTTLQNSRHFVGLIEGWHCLFRTSLDELFLHRENVNSVDIESTIMGGRIMDFVEKWKGTQSAQRIRQEYIGILDENNKLIAYFLDEVGTAPPLTQRFQHLHVMAIKDLAYQDKAGKQKKIGSMNMWQYFYGTFCNEKYILNRNFPNLIKSIIYTHILAFILFLADIYNHPERISRIQELLNIKSLEELHQSLGLRFYENRFKNLGELPTIQKELKKLEESSTLAKKGYKLFSNS
jgi:hypothetical protein